MKDVTIDAGNKIQVSCKVDLPNISPDSISVEVYSAKIMSDGTFEDINITPMTRDIKEDNLYTGEITLKTGGDYGYTFRVMPKHPMLLDVQNLNLIKWIEEEEHEEITEQERKEVEDIIQNIENI